MLNCIMDSWSLKDKVWASRGGKAFLVAAKQAHSHHSSVLYFKTWHCSGVPLQASLKIFFGKDTSNHITGWFCVSPFNLLLLLLDA